MNTTDYKMARWGFSWDEAAESSVQGIANLDDDDILLDIPCGRLLSYPGHIVIGAGPQPPEHADALFGFSQDGFYLMLEDAHPAGGNESIPGGESQRIRGRRLFASRAPFNLEDGVAGARLGFAGLREWVGESMLISKYEKDSLRLRSVEIDYEALESSEVPIYSGAECGIKVSHRVKTSGPSVEGVRISHDCEFVVDFAQRKTADEAFAFALSLGNFLTLCAGRYVPLADMRLVLAGSVHDVHLHAPMRTAPASSIVANRDMPFPYWRVRDRMDSILCCWFGLEGRAAAAAPLTVSLVAGNWEFPVDLRFIVAAQALEALTLYGADEQAIDPEVRKQCKKDALGAIEDDEARVWLERSFPTGHKGQRRLLQEFCDRNSDLVGAIVPDVSQFVSTHIDERNRYTHRSSSALVSQQGAASLECLHWHTEAVILVCYGFLWKLLGVDSQEFIDAVRDSAHWGWVLRELQNGRKTSGL